MFLIRNNKTKDVLKEIDTWKKEGRFGSKNISAVDVDYSGTNPVYLTAKNVTESQNDFIANRIKESVL